MIVSAALDVLDDGGIDAVTLRAVASRLGVQATALYHHMRNKQVLLDEMGTEIHRRVVRRVAARADAADRGHGMAADLRVYAQSLRAEYLAHRDGARSFSGTLITDPDVLVAQEPWLRSWIADGVPMTRAFDAVEAVTAFVTGFVIEEQERANSTTDADRYDPERRAERVGRDAPLTAASGYARSAPEERFARQLELLLGAVSRSEAPS